MMNTAGNSKYYSWITGIYQRKRAHEHALEYEAAMKDREPEEEQKQAMRITQDLLQYWQVSVHSDLPGYYSLDALDLV